jgi:hypothetical protein
MEESLSSEMLVGPTTHHRRDECPGTLCKVGPDSLKRLATGENYVLTIVKLI